MKYLLAFGVILVAQPLFAFPTPQKGVPAQCADPTFACQDLESAKICNVVKTCIHDIWATMSVPDDNDEICDICKEMVKEARDQLLSNMTQEEIKEVFEGSCKLLPVKIVAEGCIKIVDEIIPQLVEMLASRMDPNMVCTVSGMCFPSKRISFKKELPVQDDLQCEFCEHILEHVKDLITTNTTMDEFKNALLNFCKSTGKFSDKCTAMVNDYYDKLFTYIKNLDSKGMCTLMGLCTSSEKAEFPLVKLIPATKIQKKTPLIKIQPAELNDFDDFPLVRLIPAKFLSKKTQKESNEIFQVEALPKVSESPFCDLCKDAMNQVEQQLSDPATKQKLEDLFGQFCNMLPKSMKDDCVGFINQNIDVVISVLKEEMQPGNICPALGLCSMASRLGVSPRVKDLECNICKDVFASFRQTLQDPSSKEVVQTFLEEGCIRLPESYAAECKKFVDENIDDIMKIAIEQMDPEKVCTSLSICPASTVKSLLEEIPGVKDAECDLCKEVVGKVEDMIKDKRTEDEIKQALDSVCSYLPSSMATKCRNFVNQYTDLLISLLTQEMNPDMVCAALNLCPETAKFVQELSKAKDIECQGCQYALHFLQEKLMDAETQEEVKNVLKKMCSDFPEIYIKNCDAFIDEYGSSFLVLIAQEIDPSQLCYELKMCSNDTSIFKKVHEEISLNRFQMDECSVCTTVVDYLDKLVEEDDVDKEITQLVEKVCDVVPSSFRQQCSNILEAYAPYILQMIGQMADSRQVCQDIDLCPKSPEHVHLLGGRKCTFGPSYWCMSKDHATSCKAESFCKEKVWKN